MATNLTTAVGDTAQKPALRRRIRSLYRQFNRGAWSRCFRHLDPRLRDAGKVETAAYADSLSDFKDRYGSINIWLIRINL